MLLSLMETLKCGHSTILYCGTVYCPVQVYKDCPLGSYNKRLSVNDLFSVYELHREEGAAVDVLSLPSCSFR